MPELPEVETTARLLRPDLVGRRIRGAQVSWARTLGGQDPADLDDAVKGATIAAVGRRAKYLLVDLKRRGKPSGTIVCHLRMTGRLLVERGDPEPQAWERVRLTLDRGTLLFIDVRKFGRFSWHADPTERLGALGPEPLEDEFSASWFRRALRGRRRAIKPLLLDQGFLAGVGNIYADESLHRAGIHPLRRSDRIPGPKADRLHAEIRSTLAEAVEREGSSFDAFYRTPEGNPGSYQHQFQVYGRDGEPCRACGRVVRKIVVAQRGTHFCSRCQVAPRT